MAKTKVAQTPKRAEENLKDNESASTLLILCSVIWSNKKVIEQAFGILIPKSTNAQTLSGSFLF